MLHTIFNGTLNDVCECVIFKLMNAIVRYGDMHVIVDVHTEPVGVL